MDTLITIKGASGTRNISTYSVRDLNKMARKLVGKQGKVFAVTINFDELTGNARLIASYESAPNQQTFSSMVL